METRKRIVIRRYTADDEFGRRNQWWVMCQECRHDFRAPQGSWLGAVWRAKFHAWVCHGVVI